MKLSLKLLLTLIITASSTSIILGNEFEVQQENTSELLPETTQVLSDPEVPSLEQDAQQEKPAKRLSLSRRLTAWARKNRAVCSTIGLSALCLTLFASHKVINTPKAAPAPGSGITSAASPATTLPNPPAAPTAPVPPAAPTGPKVPEKLPELPSGPNILPSDPQAPNVSEVPKTAAVVVPEVKTRLEKSMATWKGTGVDDLQRKITETVSTAETNEQVLLALKTFAKPQATDTMARGMLLGSLRDFIDKEEATAKASDQEKQPNPPADSLPTQKTAVDKAKELGNTFSTGVRNLWSRFTQAPTGPTASFPDDDETDARSDGEDPDGSDTY